MRELLSGITCCAQVFDKFPASERCKSRITAIPYFLEGETKNKEYQRLDVLNLSVNGVWVAYSVASTYVTREPKTLGKR